MSDQSNTLNTVFTADSADAVAKIRQLINELSNLGNMSDVLATKYNAPRMVLKDFSAVMDTSSTFAGKLEQQLKLVIDQARGLVPSVDDLS